MKIEIADLICVVIISLLAGFGLGLICGFEYGLKQWRKR